MPSTSDLFAQALEQYKRPAASPATALANFDPTAALQTYGAAAAGDFNQTLKRNLSDLKGQATGAGRLKTGFYDEDTGRLTQDIAGQYQRDLASHALDASGQRLTALNEATGYGEEEQNRYLDLLSAQSDRETAERNAKRQESGGIFGGLASLAGTIGSAAILASSKRLKDDIEPIGSARERLRGMGGKSFTWKDNGHRDVGVIAEDVAREVPEAAVHDMDGHAAAVDYRRLMPVAIQAINEQGDDLARLRRVLGKAA